MKTNRRSLVTMWLDYQKSLWQHSTQMAYQSPWTCKSPSNLINALKHLITKWSTKVHLKTRSNNIVTEEIKYSKGIFQGDSLSVILFILCVNPLSFLLNKMNGYKMGGNGNRDQNITNLFFVDDLKMYATNLIQIEIIIWSCHSVLQ